MHSVPSSAVLALVAIVAAVSIAGFAVSTAISSRSVGDTSATFSEGLNATMSEDVYNDYDSKEVTGRQVISAIKQFKGDCVSIAVVSAGGEIQQYNWQYEGSDVKTGRHLTDISDKTTEKLQEATSDKTSPFYIAKTAKYIGKVIRDENTNAVMQIRFSIENSSYTVADSTTTEKKLNGGSDASNPDGKYEGISKYNPKDNKKGYYVTFVYTGANTQTVKRYVPENAVITLPKLSVGSDGYAGFQGWVNSEGTKYTQGYKVIITHDDTFTSENGKLINYNISYDLAGGEFSSDVTAYKIYNITSSFQLPFPEKKGYGFAGWKTSSGEVITNITPGTYGDQNLTATWTSETVTVRCEDYSIDYNGNKYNKLGTCDKVLHVAAGTNVDGSQWGTSTSGNVYHIWYTYYKSDSTTAEKNKQNVVYRYFLRNNGCVGVWSQYYTGGAAEMKADITVTWQDINKKRIATELFMNTTFSGVWYAWDKNHTQSLCPDGGAVTNISNVNGFGKTLNKRSGTNFIWGKSESGDMYSCSIYTGYIHWDPNTQSFDSTKGVPYNMYSGSQQAKLYNGIKMVVTKPGQSPVEVPLEKMNGAFPNGTTIKLNLHDYKAPEGYKVQSTNWFAWYCGGGIGSHNDTYLTNSTFTFDAPIHIDGGSIAQDAYGIRFDPNGGAGAMANQCISNVAGDLGRKLNKCEFKHDGVYNAFLGWSKTQGSTKVDYRDGDVVPANLFPMNTVGTLYAVWGTPAQEAALMTSTLSDLNLYDPSKYLTDASTASVSYDDKKQTSELQFKVPADTSKNNSTLSYTMDTVKGMTYTLVIKACAQDKHKSFVATGQEGVTIEASSINTETKKTETLDTVFVPITVSDSKEITDSMMREYTLHFVAKEKATNLVLDLNKLPAGEDINITYYVSDYQRG